MSETLLTRLMNYSNDRGCCEKCRISCHSICTMASGELSPCKLSVSEFYLGYQAHWL